MYCTNSHTDTQFTAQRFQVWFRYALWVTLPGCAVCCSSHYIFKVSAFVKKKNERMFKTPSLRDYFQSFWTQILNITWFISCGIWNLVYAVRYYHRLLCVSSTDLTLSHSPHEFLMPPSDKTPNFRSPRPQRTAGSDKYNLARAGEWKLPGLNVSIQRSVF